VNIFRARVDMGTAILQRRNPLSPYNELASIFQSGPAIEADPQIVKASRVSSFLNRRKYWKRSLSSRYDRPSVPLLGWEHGRGAGRNFPDSIAIGASDANGNRTEGDARRGETERAGCLPKLIF